MKLLMLMTLLISTSALAVNTTRPDDRERDPSSLQEQEQTIFDQRAEKARKNLEKMDEADEAIQEEQAKDPQMNTTEDFDKSEGSID